MKAAKISPKFFNIYFIVIHNEDERKVVFSEYLFDANHYAKFFAHKWANNKQIRLKLPDFIASPA